MKITKRQIKNIIQNELKRKSVKEGTKKDYLKKGTRNKEMANPELAYDRQDEYEVYGADQVLTGEYDMNDSIAVRRRGRRRPDKSCRVVGR